MAAIETVRKALLAELAPLERKEAEHREQADQIKSQIAPLKAALKALGGDKRIRKRCAKKHEVLEVCKAIVKENPGIDKSDLESLAVEKLAGELGYGRSGLALRLGECLSSDVFQMDEQGKVALTL